MGQLTSLVEYDVRLETLPGEKFKEAYCFWLKAKGEHELPPQSAIAPGFLPRGTLPNFSIVSVGPDAQRFHYRLIGSAIRQAWGEDLTGRSTDDAPSGKELTQRMGVCVKSRKPYYSQGPLKFAVNDFWSFAVLVMPFAGPDNEVSRLLIYNEFA